MTNAKEIAAEPQMQDDREDLFTGQEKQNEPLEAQ